MSENSSEFELPEYYKTDDYTTQTASFAIPKPNYNIRFHNKDNVEVGCMDFNGDGLMFEGNAEESAIVFIHWIDQVFRGRLEQEYQRGLSEGKQHDANT